jgi:acetylornithine deacetylase/succinyl-diaminopimelate desuccinylase-like protein
MTTTVDDLRARIDALWDADVMPTLTEYITIPNVSPAFDAAWAEHGHMEQAVGLLRDWCAGRPIEGLTVGVHRLPGLTPLIICEIPATDPALAERTVVLYGHLDKQPEMTGWRDGLGPWIPVVEGDRLYGRGGADDGYAAFAALVAIECAQAAGIAHARLVVLIEASEESGSPDLPAYVDALGERLGAPELVICLDGGCLDDQRLWLATSLRGVVNGELTVDVLTAGAHSGQASGVVPSSFRIIRQLLDRVEDSRTGEVLLPELHVDVPADRVAAAEQTAAAIAFAPADEFPFAGSTRPMADGAARQFIAQSWQPTLSYIGADGFPPPDRQGNVLRPWTRLTLSFRLPPTCDENAAAAAIEAALTADPPSGATVRFEVDSTGPGWAAPTLAPWLETALDEASTAAFGQPARSFGEGGSIPFMGMLGARFPAAQFVVTGALVPGSNAHGPDEFLHLPTAHRVTECVTRLLGSHAASPAP